jgi:hypothetical protein
MTNKLKNLVNKLLCLGNRKKSAKKENIELTEPQKVSENPFHQEEEIAEEVIATSTKTQKKGKLP